MWIITLGVVPFIIGMAGQVVQKLVLGSTKLTKAQAAELKGWKKFYHTTLAWHALLVGMFIGLVGFSLGIPVPAVFGSSLGGCMLAYTFSGGVSIVGYDTIVKTLRRTLENYKLPGTDEDETV